MTVFVYHYKATNDDGLELKYSLRGLDKFYIGPKTIWVIGDPLPSWARGIRHVPVEQAGGLTRKCKNMLDNAYIGAYQMLQEGIDRAVYLSDDHVLTDYTDEVFVTYRAPWDEHLAFARTRRGEPGVEWLVAGFEATEQHLWMMRPQQPNQLSYDIHRPFPLVLDQVVEALGSWRDVLPQYAPMWRTIYGNFAEHDSIPVRARDVRADSGVQPGSRWASTDERYPKSKRFIAALLIEPSQWETP